MNKYDFVKAVASEAGSTHKPAEEFLSAFQTALQKQLQTGEHVSLKGFGTFKRVDRKPRVGVNPKTGAKVQIPAKTVPKFTFSKEFSV